MKERIREIIDDVCMNYCKYPEKWDEEKEGMELCDSEICNNCPLNELENISKYDTSFACASVETIKKLLTKHYSGELEISDYWNVGDERTVHIGSFKSPAFKYNGNWNAEIPEHDVRLRIIGFGHDTDSTSGNKTAVTLQIVTKLPGVYGRLNNNWKYEDGDGCRAVALWSTSLMREALNKELFNAIDPELQKLIKRVEKNTVQGISKKYPHGGASQQQKTDDHIFLLSHTEFWGEDHPLTEHGFLDFPEQYNDGTQYEYFKTKENRDRFSMEHRWPAFRTSYASDGDAYFFGVCDDGGEADCSNNSADNHYDAFPGFAL